jgi:predicted ATPase
MATRINLNEESFELSRLCRDEIRKMRFFDLHPEAMRIPSLPGQTVLGDRGENLSSVLQAICDDPKEKTALASWIQGLAPMDVRDFEFPADPAGRILVTLVEKKGQRTSAYSASDGTLRVLALFAALRGPSVAQFCFFEELENGIHPTRLHLLHELIEYAVSDGSMQVVATTHSPLLLLLASPAAQEYASLTYRLKGQTDARIRRIMDIPDIRRIIERQDLGRLHESGWFENVVAFDEAESDEAAG